jgi:NADH-quinone oxidoreductase subunit M
MLSVLVFLPLAFAVIIVLVARNDAPLSRYLALGGSVLTGLVALYLAVRFNFNGHGFQFQEKYPWLPPIGASYHLGLDGLSLLLVALTVIVTPVAILMADESVAERVPLYMALVMLLETSLLGVFVSLDLVLFYLFWEGMLIPAYLLIGVWGGERHCTAVPDGAMIAPRGLLRPTVAPSGLPTAVDAVCPPLQAGSPRSRRPGVDVTDCLRRTGYLPGTSV